MQITTTSHRETLQLHRGILCVSISSTGILYRGRTCQVEGRFAAVVSILSLPSLRD